MEKILIQAAREAGITDVRNDYSFPVIIRSGTNSQGKMIHYLFNYSKDSQEIRYPFPQGKDLLSGQTMEKDKPVRLNPWDLIIVEDR